MIPRIEKMVMLSLWLSMVINTLLVEGYLPTVVRSFQSSAVLARHHHRQDRSDLRMGGYEYYSGPEYSTQAIPQKHTIFGVQCVEESFSIQHAADGTGHRSTKITHLVPLAEASSQNSQAQILMDYILQNPVDLEGRSILEVGATGIATATTLVAGSVTVAHWEEARLRLWEHGYQFLNSHIHHQITCPVQTQLLDWPLTSLPYADIVFLTVLPQTSSEDMSWESAYAAAASLLELARAYGSRVIMVAPDGGQVLDIVA